jgi:archaellum component FlaF (FlaF/FlaG flagellin family)
MLSLSDSEEILAVLIALAIIIGFIFSTYKDIISTISEEKEKLAEKKEVEEKVKTLINYLDAKTRLVNLVNKQKNKIKKEENE